MTLKDARGRKWMELTFYGPDYASYQHMSFWPNGRVHLVEHGSTDHLIRFLRGEFAARDVSPA